MLYFVGVLVGCLFCLVVLVGAVAFVLVALTVDYLFGCLVCC